MARAAMRLDAPALRELLAQEIADRGVIGAWEQVVMPVLIGIGERYEATKRLIEVEHLTSRCVSEVFAAVPRPGTNHVPRVLLSCANEEQHTLPMEALAAALAEAGIGSRLLGARVPARSLAEVVIRTGPAAVVVWSQLPGTAHPHQLTQLLVGANRPLVVAAAGPGWSSRDLPPEIPVLGSLTEAVRVVGAAVGVRRQAG
jgi:methanogenic corrinoid protein MtbC1